MTREQSQSNVPQDEFVTIVGADAEEISRTYQQEGLAGQHFTIVHRIGRHRFAFANGAPAGGLFDRPMLAATFARRAPR